MKLTRQQRPVLDLLTAGLGNAAIAVSLGLSTKTVDNHVANIKERTGINNRVLLALWWHDNSGISS